MGTCITVIKVVGASSLGLLSGNLAFQSYKKIPDLISKINNQVSISSTAAASVLRSVMQNVVVSGTANILLATLSAYLFSTAYKYSPPSGRHPYLLYCALGAPLAAASYHLQTLGADVKIVKRACLQKKIVEKKKSEQPVAPVRSSDDSPLDKSYIHVSDSSSSTTTPASSTPNSPEQPATDIQPTTSAIEQEVEEALSKKEYLNHLETERNSYKTAFAVSSAAFVVSAIGLVGEYFLH
ncbi:uncharacterized protein CXQ87_001716 [Candidozyma duobushaemuli]|uniref:Autophagy-related protein 33 n=2 Tax=Candidozyma TaxID=3303203 RepID=A0ABX8I4E0_9ASCO|nr:uncharacterized protein CXQ87_001716 [[Candida] duobushaemulonis]PVH13608.1 hypothetical protein CXQ87_001716 [[Candida] duobushaemulonis]QWU88156.1 hypothetical protein CA3LBN_002421 [[Candida] haemuloni]